MSESEKSSKQVVAHHKPIETELKAGKTYYWCRCGRSKNQPFCDGSHKVTNIKPMKFEAEEGGKVWLCQCKQTLNQPFCDGHHKQVPKEMVGEEFVLDEQKQDKGDEQGQKDSMPEPVATPEEPTVEYIHQLARDGWSKVGPYGEMGAMGVPRSELPDWNDIQFMTAQFARKPLLEDVPVNTELVIGPNAKKPLKLNIPFFVSDMSFGALSEEAKISLAKGAEKVGTGICSGEGGMLPEEQAENSRYLFEYASGKFGYKEEILPKIQAFHFKGGQAAKTGTGGHLPGNKNKGKISEIRHLAEGTNVDSPSTFEDLTTVDEFKEFADRVRDLTGGIPIGFKLSAQHIEQDIQFAVDAGADYIILDGRGGGTGDAPLMFRDHISVPTIPALGRARHMLDKLGVSGKVTLIITGGLRTPMDFAKALALGADGIALANSAIQAIGCIGARICHTNLCPSGIATQDPNLRKRLDIDVAADRLANFFEASTELVKVMARACGHDHLNKFNVNDLSSFNKEMAELAGIEWSGFDGSR